MRGPKAVTPHCRQSLRPAANGYIASTAFLPASFRRYSALWPGPDVVDASRDPKKPNRCAYAPQYRRFLDLRPIREHRCCFGLSCHSIRHNHFTAATLMFEPSCNIHSGAEVVEHVGRRDCDARSSMKSKLQHDGRCARASTPGGVKARDIVLNRERSTDGVVGTGEGGHDRVAHGLDDEAMISLHPI